MTILARDPPPLIPLIRASSPAMDTYYTAPAPAAPPFHTVTPPFFSKPSQILMLPRSPAEYKKVFRGIWTSRWELFAAHKGVETLDWTQTWPDDDLSLSSVAVHILCKPHASRKRGFLRSALYFALFTTTRVLMLDSGKHKYSRTLWWGDLIWVMVYGRSYFMTTSGPRSEISTRDASSQILSLYDSMPYKEWGGCVSWNGQLLFC